MNILEGFAVGTGEQAGGTGRRGPSAFGSAGTGNTGGVLWDLKLFSH